MLYPIPQEAKENKNNILIPLTDGKKVDQYEAKLHMQPFVPELQPTIPPSTEKKLLLDKDEDTSRKLMEEDMDVLLKGIGELDFDHPRLQKKVYQRAFNIYSNSQPTRTQATKRQ